MEAQKFTITYTIDSREYLQDFDNFEAALAEIRKIPGSKIVFDNGNYIELIDVRGGMKRDCISLHSGINGKLLHVDHFSNSNHIAREFFLRFA